MLDYIRRISIFNRIFNVKRNEWSRITLAWMIRFFYRFGFVMGWTVLVAMFVTRYGISSLPYLFILTAIFTVIGSFFYSVVLEKFRRNDVMIVTIITASLVLFLATRFAVSNQVLFFSLLITSVAVFLMQLKMLLNSYVEDMFNPLESERTFPLIEASETVGGILAGLTVTFLASGIEVFQFVYLWIVTLVLIIPLVLIYEMIDDKVEKISNNRAKSHLGVFDKLKTQLSGCPRQLAYIKGLFLIVFFQWLIFNLLEFQYTSAVYANVSEVVRDAGSGFEHAFVHDLGALFILFSSSALLVQFFVGSRLINYLGVMGSMLLHVVVTFFSLFGLTIMPNFYTAILTKNNFTITSVIYTNAYHSSYYAIKAGVRDHIREFLEGIVRPIGAIVGTLALIILQRFFGGDSLIFAVNFLMIISVIFAFIVTYRQQDKYTEVALEDLNFHADKQIRFNAIDILAQKGHKASLNDLRRVLKDSKEAVSVRVKVLRAFGELSSFEVLDDVVDCFKSSNLAIRIAALECLSSYKILRGRTNKNIFSKYNLISSLKKLYKKETDPIALVSIIHLMSQLSVVSTAEFLFSILDKGKGSNKAEAIIALGRYKDLDIAIVLEPFLRSKEIHERINAAISLYRYPDMRDESLHIISAFLFSGKPAKVAYALFAIGELKLKDKRKMCIKYLSSNNSLLKMHAAIALAKMRYFKSVPILVDLIFSEKQSVAEQTMFLSKKVDSVIASNMTKVIHHIVSQKVQDISVECDDIAQLDSQSLKHLRWCYNLVDEYEEMENIDGILVKKMI